MNPRSRTLAIVLGAAALAGAAGIGVAVTGDSAASNASPSMGRPGGPGGGGGFDLAALADELGVSESRLQEALEAARPSTGGPGPARAAPTWPRRSPRSSACRSTRSRPRWRRRCPRAVPAEVPRARTA